MNTQTKIEPSLASAMAAAFAEIEGATKSASNPHFKSKYADLTSVIEAIKPALIAHGLFFTQRPQPSEGGICIETVIGHAGGEEMSLGSLFVPANKNDAQGFGSALTYARRYALVTAFGVPVEDDDGNAAVKATREGQSQKGAVSTPALISDSDLELVMSLCEAVGDNQPGVINKAYGIKRLSELPASKAQAVINRLKEKLADKAKGKTNAMATDFAADLADEIPY